MLAAALLAFAMTGTEPAFKRGNDAIKQALGN